MSSLLQNDLECIVGPAPDQWEQLRGQNLFVTGGTGFFGCWLLESFLYANRKLGLNASITVLTRDPEGFRSSRSHLASDPAVTLHRGDVRNFDYPSGHFSHIIHAATPSSATLNQHNPVAMLDTIIDGTRRVLDFAVVCRARRFLLTSSGAVYGPQPSNVAHQPETSGGAPDMMNPLSAYAEGKRVAELLCSIYWSMHGIETLVARCFAFVGPYLPLNAHFAAGNFIRDQLQGGPIRVKGDGTTVRSYLYAADLAAWLWSILFRGEACRPYNVGSDEAVSIRELADMVATLGRNMGVEIAGKPLPGAPAERYVPDVSRATRELGVTKNIELTEALRRTSQWSRPGASQEPKTQTIGAGA
jgi:nucleoside-diphosphate-sugar epimerase